MYTIQRGALPTGSKHGSTTRQHFTRGPADVLDHATPEIAIGSKMGLDATRKLPGEGFKREWPPIIKMDETIKRKVDELLGS